MANELLLIALYANDPPLLLILASMRRHDEFERGSLVHLNFARVPSLAPNDNAIAQPEMGFTSIL